MLDQKIRPIWDGAMRPVGRALGRTGLTPNSITAIGVLIQVGVAALIVDGRLLAAGLVAIAAALADTLDGAVAKARGAASEFGALLDSTTDRLTDALFFAPVAWLYGVDPVTSAHDRPWVAAIAIAALVLSFLVSYVKARAEGLGYECKVGIAERAERTIIMILALVFDVLPAALGVLAVLSLITLVQRVVHVRRQVITAR